MDHERPDRKRKASFDIGDANGKEPRPDTPKLIGSALRNPPVYAQPGRWFAEQPIDLSPFDVGLREHAQLQEYIARMFRFVVEDAGLEMQTLLQLLLQPARTIGKDTVLTNILSGRTQLGKTLVQAAILYVSVCCLGVRGLALVRSNGGDESIASLTTALNALSDRVVQFLTPPGGQLAYFVESFFRPQIVSVDDYYNSRAEIQDFGRMQRPLIIIGRQNVAAYKKLFKFKGAAVPANIRKRFFVDWTQNRFVLVCDEDDIVHSTPNRVTTVTETASMKSGEAPFGLGQTSRPQDHDDDDDDETDLAFAELLAEPCVRAAATMLVAVSATWFAVAMTDKPDFRQLLNVIPMPLHPDYVGFASEEGASSPRRQVVIRTVDGAAKKTKSGWTSHKIAVEQVMDSCLRRYKDEHHHISLHINTHRTFTNGRQDAMARGVVKAYGHRQALITFCYNQLVQKCLHLSPALATALLHSFGHSVARTTAWLVETVQRCLNMAGLAVRVGDNLSTLEFGSTKKASISQLYDIAIALFAKLGRQPFVVCVTGALGGRQLTLKDSAHRYVLTDMLLDCTRQTHFEKLIQTAGRICSKDPYHRVERYLWTPEWVQRRLRTAYGFYDEMQELCVSHRPCDFIELVRSITVDDEAVVRTLKAHTAITRRLLMRPMWDVMSQIARCGTDHLAHARAVEHVLHYHPNGLALHEIVRRLTVREAGKEEMDLSTVFYILPKEWSKLNGLVSTALRVARENGMITMVDADSGMAATGVQGRNYKWVHNRHLHSDERDDPDSLQYLMSL